MATKIGLLNEALGYLGMRLLTSAQVTTPNDEPSRVLSDIYDNALLFCLEQGHWKFASITGELTPSLTEIPTFGYTNAFAKPANYVRLNRMCVDEYFNIPSSNFDDRAGFWYADEDIIYVDYVSSDATTRGLYLAGWPTTFAEYVSLHLAHKVSRRLQPDKEDDLEAKAMRAKLNALAKDAVLGPTQFLPPGKWTRARSDRMRARSSNSSFYGS
jgi:hypothetical protein